MERAREVVMPGPTVERGALAPVQRSFVDGLEGSLQKTTAFAAFEANGPDLWSKVRTTVESALLAEFHAGKLKGSTPEQAFVVRCDRTTMTQADVDNGQLNCVIGVAVVRPAEFVIFRFGQQTGCPKCSPD